MHEELEDEENDIIIGSLIKIKEEENEDDEEENI